MALSPTGVLPGSPGSQVTESASAQPPLDERASRVSERHPLGSAALQRLGFRWLGWLRLGLSAGFLLDFRLGSRFDFGFGLISAGFCFGLDLDSA